MIHSDDVIPIEIIAAFTCTLQNSQCTILDDFKRLCIVAQCILAAWGRSDLARYFECEVSTDVITHTLTKFNTDLIVSTIMQQPFMSKQWSVPKYSALAVRCLVHEWDAGLIDSNSKFIDVALAHCQRIGRLIYPEERDVWCLRAIGSQYADLYYPYGGSGTPLPLRTRTE